MLPILLTGSYEWALRTIPEKYRKVDADVVHFFGDRMGIEDVRLLIKEAHLAPLVRDERVFILAYRGFTIESQNALLKILEEPPKTARFYIVMERPQDLLATLRSRLLFGEVQKISSVFDHSSFLKLDQGDRLTQIAEKIKEKDDVWLSSLMDFFEVHAHGSRNSEIIKVILDVRPFFNTQGASRKMILEHCALCIPKLP